MLAAGATAFVAAVVVGDLDDARVRRSGLLAVASVLDVEDSPKAGASADIRFRTRAGDVVTTVISVDDAAALPHVGDAMDVRYLRDDPAGSAVMADVSRRRYWTVRFLFVPTLVVSAALPALAVAGFSLRRTQAGVR